MDFVFDYIAPNTFWTILLIIHGLLAVALLGALTHQAMSVLAPAPHAAGAGFVTRFRAVHGPGYAAAVCALWIATFVFGAWIYTEYRIYVRIPIEQAAFWKTQGSFEMKEHLATIGLGLLPIYGTSGSIPRTRTTTARGNGSRRISPARAGLFFWWARSSTT